MPHISSPAAALSLLQQGSLQPGAVQRNAADAILDIVSGARKAAAVPQSTATTSPREAGARCPARFPGGN